MDCGQPVDWPAFDDPARTAALSAGAVVVFAHTVRVLRNPLLLPILRLTQGPEKVNKGLENIPDFERVLQRAAPTCKLLG